MKFKLRFFFYPLFVLTMLLSGQHTSFAQARLVFGTTSDVYMVMSNTAVVNPATPIYLVMGNTTTAAAANSITRAGSFGRIISNSEKNIVKWYIGNNTGTYTIPWGYDNAAGTYIPFTFNISSAGSAAGNVRFINFTTYRTAANNLASAPAGVTNDWSSACACNASPWMVDRFWMVDNADYGGVGQTPTGELTFYYVDGGGANPEVTTTGNSLTSTDEPNLQAESYNGSSNLWTGSLYGTDDDVNNKVGPTATIPASKLDKWWTLVEKNHPLPVTWLSESAECNRGDITVKWSTASEQNSDFFTVERSYDGANFTDLANVLAAGQSTTVKNYSYIDAEPIAGLSYYRVRETDFNSTSMLSEQMAVNGCSNDDIFIYGSEGGVSINIDAAAEGKYSFELYDVLGQKLMNEAKTVTAGSNHLKIAVPNIASAMYVVKVYSASNVISKKVFVRAASTQ